jgi:hypothetical protein
MSTSGPQLTDSLVGLHRAAANLQSEAERLAESLRGKKHDLRAAAEGPELPPVPQPKQALAQPLAASTPELLPQVIAAFVPIVAFALVEVHLALAMAVALVGVLFLQVRWWMLAVSTLSLLVLLLIEPGLREGATVDRVAGLIVLFTLMAFALLLQEALERVRRLLS